MNFFRKSTNTEPVAEVKPQPQQPVTPTPTTGQTAEELARQWWQERYGEPMPEEVTRWMKQLTRAEARRLTTAASLLSDQKIARIEDARRLAETKLRNIESSLQRIHDQQEWLHRFSEKKHELTEHRNRLYEVNKQLAMVANDEKELDRFEQFETVQGLFQRMMLLESQSRANKQAQSALANPLEETQRQVNESQKLLKQTSDDRNDAAKQMLVVRDQLEEANRILGARTILELDEKSSERLFESISQQRLILGKEADELESQLESLQEVIGQQCTKRQAMEPHLQLMEHGDMVLTLLERLQQMKEELATLNRTQETELRKQQEENEMLNRVFADYQNVESDIKSLGAELHLHRQNNLGRSSYSLQERAMQLKSRRQMLIAAQSLWNRIQLGYALIEEKTQTVNRLRLNLDNLKQNIEELEAKVVPMRQLCHEKEYTLTLSKSQNVIQLRGDLQEGVACTVCGATHHPYHSDTMLEQSQFINDLRVDYELISAQLASNEEQLRQLQLQRMAEVSRRDVEEETLSRLRQRQMEDVKEWRVFASLDRTFEECSSSTNMEARTALLRQLIENTAYDADDAQKELDDYNFNQTRINEISEQLSHKEQQKNDLTVRLNEVNTSCQVLARQVEQTRQARTQMQDAYTQLYERLTNLITINEWYAQWQENPEGLRLRIQQMMETWQRLNADIQQLVEQQHVVQAQLTDRQQSCAYLDSINLQVREDNERRRIIWKEGESRYQRMLGQQEVGEYFATLHQQLLQAQEKEAQHREKTQEAEKRLAQLQGRQQELVAQNTALDSETVSQRSQLDVWMRKFNANHPPVQYAELERAFALEKDWNATRQKVRGVRIEAMLEEARVDALRSTIVALQAEGMRPSNAENADVLESLVAQQKQLEKQRQDVLMQLAEQRIALNRHEECTARLKAEEEELYAISDKT